MMAPERAAPMPGRASSSSALALLRSTSAPLAAFGGPATGAVGLVGAAGAAGAGATGFVGVAGLGVWASAGAAARQVRTARVRSRDDVMGISRSGAGLSGRIDRQDLG